MLNGREHCISIIMSHTNFIRKVVRVVESLYLYSTWYMEFEQDIFMIEFVIIIVDQARIAHTIILS